MIYKDKIIQIIENSIRIKEKIIKNEKMLSTIEEIIKEIIKAFKNKKKILLCGNGGSAADAQHIAAEFLGKFYLDRDPLFAEALHVNTSYLTAVANDYSYDEVFSRIIKAKGEKGDILIAISTSGNSKNIVNALKEAKKIGLITIGLTGEDGGEMKNFCDYIVNIPSRDTPRIQEVHILIGHIICELVESKLFSKRNP